MEEAREEVDALRSIYEEELQIEDNTTSIVVTKKVRPTDDENGPTASVICQFTLRPGYPEDSPQVVLSRPRGLTEPDFVKLERDVEQRLAECRGMPVIFDILQLCSDFFICHRSDLPCPICLCSLSTGATMSTPCEHYLHKTCMEQHVLMSRRVIATEMLQRDCRALHKPVDKALYCPVCREMVEPEVKPLFEESPKKKTTSRKLEEGHADFSFDWSRWRAEQSKMRTMYAKQQQQGGIIDLEAEKRKNLITEDTMVELPPAPSNPVEEPGTSGEVEDHQQRTKNRTQHHRPRPNQRKASDSQQKL